jgi:hypothetical protein
MADEVEALKGRRKAMMREITGTFKRSKDPHPKHRRANLIRQINLLDRKIRQTRSQVRKAIIMGKVKETDTRPLGDTNSWSRTHGSRLAGRAYIDEADLTAVQMETRWGAGRLLWCPRRCGARACQCSTVSGRLVKTQHEAFAAQDELRYTGSTPQ